MFVERVIRLWLPTVPGKYPKKNALSWRKLLEAQRRQADAAKMPKLSLHGVVHPREVPRLNALKLMMRKNATGINDDGAAAAVQ